MLINFLKIVKNSRVFFSISLFQVMFSDGIRPGGDLTELDGSPERRRSRRSRSNGYKKSRSSKHHVSHGPVGGSDIAKCLIPYNAMPHISGEGPIEDAVIVKRLMDGECLSFLINKNLKVLVKQLHCKFFNFMAECRKLFQKSREMKILDFTDFIKNLQMLRCQITFGIFEHGE